MAKTSSSKDSKAWDNYNNYRFCYDNGHDEWVQRARICFDFWRSRQWLESDRVLMAAANRPALTFNVIFSLIRTMKGIQKALRNDVRFMPQADADMQDAAVRDAIWLDVSNENQLLFKEGQVWEKGLITGRAYYKTVMEFDENTRGQIKITVPRSQDIVLDPYVDQYDAKDWPRLFHVPWVTLHDIEHLFGKAAADELGINPTPSWYDYDDVFMGAALGRLPYYTYGDDTNPKMRRAYRLLTQEYKQMAWRDVFVDLNTGETKPIPKEWDRERVQKVLAAVPGLGTDKKRVQTVKVLTTCENTVLRDEESQCNVFSVTPFFPAFVDGVARGIVEDLIDPQMLLNKMTSQELAIINTTANSGWITEKGNLVGITRAELEKIGAKPGFVLTVNSIDKTQKITANQVPQGHEKLSLKADQMLRSIAGVSNQSRGFAREDVAGEAILANQAATDVNFADALDNLHYSKQNLAHTCQAYWTCYYDETRVILMNRGSNYRPDMQSVMLNQPTPEGHVLNDITMGKFTTTLIPAPTRTTLSDGDMKNLVMLKKDLGVKIPDDVLIEASPLSNKLALIQRLKGDSSDHQDAQRHAELQQQQLAAQTEQAKAEKERSAAELNVARAAKFRHEADIDPDAAYERVETRRIDAEERDSQRRFVFDREKLRLQRETAMQHTATELTKLDHEAHENAKDRVVDVHKTRLQSQKRLQATNKKPAAKPTTKGKKQ